MTQHQRPGVSDLGAVPTVRKLSNRSSEELAMREMLVPWMRQRWPGARIIHELPLRYSTNRIDLAAVTETEINAVEIKSSRDVADRLEQQIRAFAPISARVIVALAPKWNEQLPPVRKTLRCGGTTYSPQRTPVQATIHKIGASHVETWTVAVDASSMERTEGGYVTNDHPWAYQMLHILHVAELWQVASRHQVYLHGKSPTHATIVRDCCHALTGAQVKRAVCAALRAREAFCGGTDPAVPLPPVGAVA
ncbi:hypothetical protein NFI95_15660 [Acetobacteraceae bacterium KSS8]|uniref:Sce7726 family protein n=1 Tax=Endosaccharibacter trunci TaxID=2812733 RepID=A0ABT1WAH1_9PROT|nr:hypothetical protein [Acetobacteraceae bacterium KSS8]